MIKIITTGLILVTGLFSTEIEDNSSILVTQSYYSNSVERSIKFNNVLFTDTVSINKLGNLDGYKFNNTKCKLFKSIKKNDSIFTCPEFEVNVFIRRTSTGSKIFHSTFNFKNTSESVITETKNKKFIRIATDLNLIVGSGKPILFK